MSRLSDMQTPVRGNATTEGTMGHLKRLVVMYSLNVSSSVADAVLGIMERAGVNEESVTLREYVVAAGAAYADHREQTDDGHRAAG
jgi:hypothetical protein